MRFDLKQLIEKWVDDKKDKERILDLIEEEAQDAIDDYELTEDDVEAYLEDRYRSSFPPGSLVDTCLEFCKDHCPDHIWIADIANMSDRSKIQNFVNRNTFISLNTNKFK